MMDSVRSRDHVSTCSCTLASNAGAFLFRGNSEAPPLSSKARRGLPSCRGSVKSFRREDAPGPTAWEPRGVNKAARESTYRAHGYRQKTAGKQECPAADVARLPVLSFPY